jgi:hypothetical protein
MADLNWQFSSASDETFTNWIFSFLTIKDMGSPPYKKNAYRRHIAHVKELEGIFIALSYPMAYGALTLLSRVAHISKSTFGTRKRKLRDDPTWRSSYPAYGDAHRLFADEQEAELRMRISRDYLNPGLYYCDEDFKRDAILFFQEFRAQLEQEALGDPLKALQLTHIPEFKASPSIHCGFPQPSSTLFETSVSQETTKGQQRTNGGACCSNPGAVGTLSAEPDDQH